MTDTVVSKSLIQRQPINVSTGSPSPIDNDLPTMHGTVTANGATPVTVANTNVTANSVIIFTVKTVNTLVSVAPAFAVATITAGTGFTAVGQATDVSVYNYRIFG